MTSSTRTLGLLGLVVGLSQAYPVTEILASGMDFGGFQTCTDGSFLYGTCASGSTVDCGARTDPQGYISFCATEGNYFAKAPIPTTWAIPEKQGEWVTCQGINSIAIGLCSSKSSANCAFRDGEALIASSFALQCTQSTDVAEDDDDEAPHVTLDMDDCYSVCRGAGDDATCDIGYGVTSMCSSLSSPVCRSEWCAESVSEVSHGVRCCKLKRRPTSSPTTSPTSVADGSESILATRGSALYIVLGVSAVAFVVILLILYRRVSSSSDDLVKKKGSRFHARTMFTNATQLAVLKRVGTADSDELMTAEEKMFHDSGTQNMVIHPNHLEVGTLLSKGGEGRVFKGRYGGSAVAIKEIMNGENKLTESFQREFEHLRLIQHPNIIRLFGVCVKKSEDTGLNRYLLVMELARCSLRQVIKEGKLELTKALDYAYQICLGCSFIHDHGMIHQDIKPENILIDKSGKIKICDLGLAKLATSRSSVGAAQLTMTTNLGIHGTPAYIAPERVHDFNAAEAINARPRRVSTAVDVYSFGVVLWELYHLKKPYPPDWDGYKIIAEMKIRSFRPLFDPHCPTDVKDVIEQCWATNPKDRPTFNELQSVMKNLVLKRLERSSKGGTSVLTSLGRVSNRLPKFPAKAKYKRRSAPMLYRQPPHDQMVAMRVTSFKGDSPRAPPLGSSPSGEGVRLEQENPMFQDADHLDTIM